MLYTIITLAFFAIVIILGVNYWIKGVQPFLSLKIKKRGVETTGKIVDFRERPSQGTKIMYLMNVEYETPQGTIKRFYRRSIVKDKVITYREKYGKYFYVGQELPVAYLPEKPDKFVVLHPVELDEKKRVNVLCIATLAFIIVAPAIIYLMRGLVN